MRRVLLLALILLFAGSPLDAADISSFDGEKITYDIRKFGVGIGEASIEYRGRANIDGRELYLLIFRAKAPKFYDEELIYMDLGTLYPVKVVRDLDIWGSKEKISEEYFYEQGLVKITKTVDGKTEHIEIRKKERIDNIYCFIARLRLQGHIDSENIYNMYLPTKDVVIKYNKLTKIRAGGEPHEAHHLRSDPKQYEVWFDNDEGLIPLRIDGGHGLVSSIMVMSKYEKR